MKLSRALAFGLVMLASCKRSPPPAPAAASDGGASGTADAGAASWDGPFGAARTPAKGIVLAVAGAATPSLGIVELDAKGTEKSRHATTQLTAPLRGAPSVVPFAAGGVAVVYAARHGEPQVATMLSATGEPIADAHVVGADFCGTDDALYFIEKGTRRLRRWDRAAREPRAAEGAAFAEHSTPLCAANAAFVLEPKASGFDVVVTPSLARAHVADGIDPQSGGGYAAYVGRDGVGLAYALPSGAIAWTTIGPDGKATTRTLKRKIGGEETIVAADGAADRLALLLQHDDKKRCGEDETPPAYDLVEAFTAPVAERVAALPPAACDSEASAPDVQVTTRGAVARWFETKEGAHEKRLVFFAAPPPGAADAGKGTSGDRRVPDDTFLLDCDDDCLAVGREGGRFRVVAVP